MRNSYVRFNPNKSLTKAECNELHDAKIEEIRDVLDNVDFLTNRLNWDKDEIYFYLDDKLTNANNVAKNLRRIALNPNLEIDYDLLKIDIAKEYFDKVMDTLKCDVKEYLALKDNLNEIARQQKNNDIEMDM